jgi:lysozyme family protein
MTIDGLLEDLLRREGGYVNNPADRGGPTNLGITQKTLSAYYGRPASIEDVKRVTPELAREIYSRIYLDGPGIHTMPAEIVPALFDAAVNSGPRQSIIFLQQVLNFAGYGPLQADGAIGPKTRAAAVRAQSEMGAMLLAALVDQRRAFLEGLMQSDPRQQQFRRGWIRRLLEFMYEALRQAPDDAFIKARIAAYEQEAA